MPEELRKVKGESQRVLLLMHNDRAAVDRLFAHVRIRNPDQSEKWCWEKILWDLEHDRH